MSNPARLYIAASRLWAEYQQQGPGHVRAELWDDVTRAWNALRAERTSLPPAVQEHGSRIVELCRRCALRPEGLSFVTGEAGLVPRQDLHEELTWRLLQLAQAQNGPAD